jgi:hypothetical protein
LHDANRILAASENEVGLPQYMRPDVLEGWGQSLENVLVDFEDNRGGGSKSASYADGM